MQYPLDPPHRHQHQQHQVKKYYLIYLRSYSRMEMGQNWAQGIVIVIVGSLYPLQNLQKELFLVLQAITGRVFCPVKAVCMCFY